jgi:hypothetical protein
MGGYATVNLMVASEENPDAVAYLTINAVPAPDLADVLVGDYSVEYFNSYAINASIDISVNFAPTSEGATEGVMTVVAAWMDLYEWVEYNVTEIYNYSVVDGALVTELVSTDYGDEPMPISIVLNDNYGVSVVDPYGPSEELTREVVGVFSAGEYRYMAYDENDKLQSCYQLIVYADGTGTFKYRTWDSSNYEWVDVFTTAFTWESDSEGITITVTDETYLVSGTYAYGEYENDYGMTDYGVLNVAVVEGEATVFYDFPINEFYN